SSRRRHTRSKRDWSSDVCSSDLRWGAVIGILLVAAKIFDQKLPANNALYVEAGLFVLAGRVMWAVLQWMGRLYVLTDLRILRLEIGRASCRERVEVGGGGAVCIR